MTRDCLFCGIVWDSYIGGPQGKQLWVRANHLLRTETRSTWVILKSFMPDSLPNGML
jgi:hypothetical protein